jgi:hypothetical protein
MCLNGHLEFDCSAENNNTEAIKMEELFKKALKLAERVNYVYNAFCVYIADLSDVRVNDKVPFKTVLKEALCDLGIRNKATREVFKQSYAASLKKRGLFAYILRRNWRAEAWKCACHGIVLENSERFSSKQLRELRKAAAKGFDCARIANHELSPLDMRLALPYLGKNEEVTHEAICRWREARFSI